MPTMQLSWLRALVSMIELASPALWWGSFAEAPSSAPALPLSHPDEDLLIADQLRAWVELLHIWTGLVQMCPKGERWWII